MALQAGRVGVHPSQVDLLGKIKMLPFIKRVTPWQAKGKWYKITTYWNQTDKSFTVIKSDIPVVAYSASTVTIGLPANFICINSVVINKAIANYKNVRGDLQYGYGSNRDRMQIYLGVPGDFGYSNTIEVWIFGYYEVTAGTSLLSDEQPVQSVRKVAKASKVDEPVEETTDPIEEPINTDTE